jgi:ATP-binding cassette subfamily F protein uup
MADPDFYRGGAEEIGGARQRLERIERELAEAYGRWEVLEEKRGG